MLLATIDTIPQELIARDHPITLIVGLGMFLSFILIALAKLIQADIYLALAISFFKNKGLYNYIRESLPIQKAGSLLLLINYWIAFSLLLLLIYKSLIGLYDENIWLIVAVPLGVLVYNIVGFYSVGLFTGEQGVMQTPILMKVTGAQFLGIGCSILVFLISMHFIDEEMFIQFSIILLVSENTLRLIRSLVYVFAHGVSWYYIIMYFCTLEILPLLMTYYVLLVD